MPTPEEIKRIARFFAYETSNGDALDPHIDFAEEFAAEVLQWLSKGYCIVPKNDIKRYYNVDKCTIRDHKKRCGDKAQTRAAARIRLCESLFGTELFNEDSQVSQEK